MSSVPKRLRRCHLAPTLRRLVRHFPSSLGFADMSIRSPTVQLLEILKRRLHTVELAEPSSMRVLSNPRVPLVKFCTTEAFGSFSFDVSLNDAFDECGAPNSNGSAGARVSLRLMRDLEEGGDLERLKRLVMFFKVFLDCHGWNSARDGGLGGMSVFCLVVSFLQVRFPPPSIPALLTHSTLPQLDDRPPSQQSAAQDLLAFLHYCALLSYCLCLTELTFLPSE